MSKNKSLKEGINDMEKESIPGEWNTNSSEMKMLYSNNSTGKRLHLNESRQIEE